MAAEPGCTLPYEYVRSEVMTTVEKQTQTINATDVRQHWSELLSEVFKEQKRLVVERSGVPVAAIISARDLERFQRMERERAADFAIIDELREAFKDVPDDV